MATPHCPKHWIHRAHRVLTVLRDAVKYTPGGSRFATLGKTVQPLDTGYAAEICGRSERYMSPALNPNDDSHSLQLKDFLLLLQADLDTSVISEVCDLAKGVFVPVQPNPEDADLPQLAIQLGKEFGDIFTCLAEAQDERSSEGCHISLGEADAFSREIRELVAKALALDIAVRRSVS